MTHDQVTAAKPIGGAMASTNEDQPVPERKPRLDLSIPQLLAGALAAASAAVAASWLGVAGTVLGALVASVVVSVSSALYKHSLERSSQVIRETLPVLPERPRGANGASTAETLPPTAPVGLERRSPGATSARASRRVRWGVVAVSTVVTLVVGLGMLTALETVLGRSVSSLTGSDGDGGTTVGRLISHGTRSDTSPGSGSDTSTGNGTRPADPAPSGPSGSAPSTGASTSPPTTQPPTTQPPTTAPQTSTEPTPTEPTAPAPSVSGQPPAANTALAS